MNQISTENVPVTLKLVATWLQELGYRGEVNSDGHPFVHSAADGHDFYIFGYGDGLPRPDAPCATIRLQMAWGGFDDANVMRLLFALNRFNAGARFSRALALVGIDRELGVGIEIDAVTANGMSRREFHGLLNFFIDNSVVLLNGVRDTNVFDMRHPRALHNEALKCVAEGEPGVERALQLYRQAAAEGYGGSQNNLGELYETGRGVAPNLNAAVHYYTRSAERGQPTAYLGLASVLSMETKDEELLIEAAKFAVLASRELPEGRNREEAQARRLSLEERLCRKSWDRAVELAEHWRPLVVAPGRMQDTPGGHHETVVEGNQTIN